jgi:hypothetical protein
MPGERWLTLLDMRKEKSEIRKSTTVREPRVERRVMQIENAQQAYEATALRIPAGISKPEVPDELLERIRERSESWRQLLGTMGREGKLDRVEWKVLLGSWSVWQTSVEHLVDALSWIAGRQESKAALEKLAEPAEVFRRYAHNVAKRVAGSSDAVERSAGAGALAIASEQMSRSTALADEAMAGRTLEVGKEAERTGPSLAEASPESLVFYAQEKELAAHGKPLAADDPDAIRRLSTSAQREELAYRIGQLICQCNRASRFAGRPEIFRPTTTLIQAISSLPFVVVTDRVSLGTFDDCLYFALYEDAGGAKLAYLIENGGVMQRTEPACDAIWAIRALGNKLLRHDPDNWPGMDVEKSWAELSERLAAIGVENWPVTIDDFTRLQGLLLDRVTGLLRELLRRLS